MDLVIKNKYKIILILTMFFVLIFPAYSNAANVSVGQVKNLKATSRDTSSITLKWNKVSKATGYKIYFLNTSTGKFEYKTYTKTNSIKIKKLKSSKQYKIRVRAYKTVKGKKYYGKYSSVLKNATTPEKVNKVKVKQQTDNTIKISWSSVSRASGYKVYVYNSSKKSYQYYGKTTSTSMTIKKLSAATTYKIKVRAYKTNDSSKFYGAYSKVLETCTVPSKPTKLKSSSETENSIKVSWKKVTRATGYRVYVYNNKKKTWEKYKELSDTSIKISKLNAGDTYKIKVRAYKKQGSDKCVGSYSSVLETTTVPGKVSGVKASSQTDNSIKVSWKSLNGATKYRVYVYNPKTKGWDRFSDVSGTSVTITNLSEVKEYKIRMRAYKKMNDTKYFGAYCNEIKTTTTPKQVKNLETTKQTTSSITVKWDKVSKAKGYGVYVYNDGSGSYKLYSTTTGTSIEIKKLLPARFYRIYVKAYTEYNDSNYYGKESNMISVHTLEEKNTRIGMDISKYQPNVDWNKVKKAGVKFVMLRIGYRGYGKAGNIAEDECFSKHIKNALNAGMEVGVYFFAYAKDEDEAQEEADWVLKTLKKYEVQDKIKYIAYDFESFNKERVKGVSNSQITKNAIKFLQCIKDAKYTPLLYGNKNDLTKNFDTNKILSKVEGCKVWLAQYNTAATYDKDYDMWQYTSAGRIDGISGDVDLDIIYF